MCFLQVLFYWLLSLKSRVEPIIINSPFLMNLFGTILAIGTRVTYVCIIVTWVIKICQGAWSVDTFRKLARQGYQRVVYGELLLHNVFFLLIFYVLVDCSYLTFDKWLYTCTLTGTIMEPPCIFSIKCPKL